MGASDKPLAGTEVSDLPHDDAAISPVVVVAVSVTLPDYGTEKTRVLKATAVAGG
jgi:hypothetical protein